MAVRVGLLLCVLLLAGCGAEGEAPQAESGAEPTTSESLVELGAWGVDMAEPEIGGDGVSLADELAVFSRPGRAEDEYPGLAADLRSDSVEGGELPARSRLLLRGVAKESFDDIGEQRLSLYAVPTENGWVCAYVLYEDLGDFADGTAGACEPGLVRGFGLELQGAGSFYRLYGVVEDGIERVSFRVGDRLLPARVGSNGIYFHARTTDVCPVDIEHVVVERADGSKTEVPWIELAPSFIGASRESFGCR
jgi:hypothetical protein